jgi:hypothetical protein
MTQRGRSYWALPLAVVALDGLSGCPSFAGFDEGGPDASTSFADAPVDGDAGAGASDAQQTPCLASHAFCDDFDGRDAGWTHFNVNQGTAAPDQAQWVSPPRSLHTVVPAASSVSSADWDKDFAFGWRKTQVDLDLWLEPTNWDAGAPGANVNLLEVLFFDSIANPVTGSIFLSADGVAASAQDANDGFVASQATRLSEGAWHHITLVADPSLGASQASTVVTVDGNPFQSVNYTARAPVGQSFIAVSIGPVAWNAGRTSTPPYEFHIDNATIDFP